MKTQLARWGNSMAVRIPKAIAEAARLRPGDQLEMAIEASGTLRIRKKRGKQKLSQLIRGINATNLHGESDWGAPAGKELW